MKQCYVIKQRLFFALLLGVFFFGYAQVPSYYSGTDISQTGEQLKTNLSTLISSNTVDLGYTPGIWNALKQTDLDPNNGNNVLLIYGYDDNDGNYKTDRTRDKNRNGGSSGTDWNREHSYPKSLGQPNLGTSGPGSDAHHLRASDVSMNSSRGNKPYIDIENGGNARAYNNGWYPGDEWKGDVARMMMYMYLRYGERCNINRVGSGASTYNADIPNIFLEWNAEDPVSQYELNRNTILEGLQGNRNPFIDNPAFATLIWGGPQAEDRFNNSNPDNEAPTAPVNLVYSNVKQTEVTLSWDASTDNRGVVAYQIFNGTTLLTTSTNTSVTVSGLSPNTEYVITVKAIDAASNVSESSNQVTFTTLEDVVNPPAGDFIAFQGYETNDTWAYQVNPVKCNQGSDVWDVVTSIGSINSPKTGSNFFGVRDLEGNCGSAEGGTITFDAIDITNYKDVKVSFAINVVGYDVSNGDAISYQLIVDGVAQEVQVITVGSPFSTNGWEEITADVPSSAKTVGLQLNVKQNGGSDYAGFDDVKLLGTKVNTAPKVIINEVDADTPGTDKNEFVELFDGGLGNTSLDGLVLVFYNGSNNQSYRTIDLTGQTTNAEGYFVVGNEAVANVNIVIPSNGLQNGQDAVALYSGEASNYPNGSEVTTENLVDAFVYDTNDADDAELLVLLNNGQPQVNEDGAGNKNEHSSQRIPNGEGGARNTSNYAQLLPTPGKANGATVAVPSILINELDADTAGTDTLEFVELFDGGAGNTSLDGLVLVFYNGSNNQSYRTIDLAGQTTNAEGYFVVGNEAVANVNIVIPSNGLQNGADAVALYAGSEADFPNGSEVTTDNLIDAVVYDTNDNDDAELLVLLNDGQPQLNEDEKGEKDTHSLQRSPNGEGGARNTSSFTQAVPTPGKANDGVINPPNPTEPIAIADARAKADGEEVIVTGVLTVADEFRGSAYIQDSTAAIAIFDKKVHGDSVFKIGDSITLTATRSAFNDQIQLSKVSKVVNHGAAKSPIKPKVISLSQLQDYPAQLVKIVEPNFPKPGDMFFGNSNYQLTDTSGNGQLRIDLDVADIVGLGQPESCTEVVGVVGRFRSTYQLLPRNGADLACATEYQIPESPVSHISKDKTLDIVTWNIEWFGDEKKSPAAGDPNSDQIQKDSVKSVINKLDADIIAVQEIVDTDLFAQLINELPAYNYVLSDAVSYPNDTEGVSQKVGYIYKKSVVNVKKTEALLKSIHPYYNGGDASAISDFPAEDKSRFYASGRLPFLLTADVTINGETEEYNFVALHARANNNKDAQNRYNMRKYDVEVLKDSLDARFSDVNLVLLGDYNDDVDETVVADKVTDKTSTYDVFIKDTDNYTIVSEPLTTAGFRSFVFVENMIDHITVSNELNANYLEGSERVHYEYYSNKFSRTTSDHFPVSTRLRLKSLELVDVTSTGVTCNGAQDGTATITVSGGIHPYTYLWSNGAETASVTGLTAGTYNVTVTDALGKIITQEYTIEEPTAVEVTISENTTVYKGYDEHSCTVLEVLSVEGGTAPYTYEWSNGETTEVTEVCPEEDASYSVTITDANGCSITKTIDVKVIDVVCGNPYWQRVQICYRGRTRCVSSRFVDWYLGRGAVLGSCNEIDEVIISQFYAYPNPFRNNLRIMFRSNKQANAQIMLYDYSGNVAFTADEVICNGRSRFRYNLSHLTRGSYIIKVVVDGEVKQTRQLYKY